MPKGDAVFSGEQFDKALDDWDPEAEAPAAEAVEDPKAEPAPVADPPAAEPVKAEPAPAAEPAADERIDQILASIGELTEQLKEAPTPTATVEVKDELVELCNEVIENGSESEVKLAKAMLITIERTNAKGTAPTAAETAETVNKQVNEALAIREEFATIEKAAQAEIDEWNTKYALTPEQVTKVDEWIKKETPVAAVLTHEERIRRVFPGLEPAKSRVSPGGGALPKASPTDPKIARVVSEPGTGGIPVKEPEIKERPTTGQRSMDAVLTRDVFAKHGL